MTIRTPILTLVVSGLAWVAPAAQAQALAGGEAVTAKTGVSAKSALSVMTVAGIRYHAQANYANEKRLFGPSASIGVRPDDRSGVRGI